MRNQRTPWFRAGLAYLTMSFLAVGAWASFAPASFYARFPGWGHHWLAGDGPYNAHLVTDAGVGFLAVGAVLLFAALRPAVGVVRLALVGALVHGVPHLLFHVFHADHLLSSIDRVLSTGSLAVNVVVAAVLLVVLGSSAAGDGRSADATAVSPGRPVKTC